MDWITPEHVIAARREIAERSLVDFVKMAWHVLEPGQEYKHGRHIDVVAEHLEAAMRGEIRRLSINVPPGSMKSLMCGVFLPAWMWGPKSSPSMRFLGVAHEQGLGVRDNLKCRRLIESPWFQNTWGDRVSLAKDQNEKLNFENTAKGWRAVATPSNITGKRADVVTCLRGDQRVLSDHGWIEISRIVNERLNVRIAGTDGRSYSWQSILRYEKNPPREALRIVSGGREIVCTVDHPVYVSGRGWVVAGQIRAGDRIVLINEEGVCKLRQSIRDEKASGADLRLKVSVGVKAEQSALSEQQDVPDLLDTVLSIPGSSCEIGRGVLQPRMRREGQGGREQSGVEWRATDGELRVVQEGLSAPSGTRGEARDSALLGLLQGNVCVEQARQEDRTNTLQVMRREIQAKVAECVSLQQGVRSRYAIEGYQREWEWALRPRASQGEVSESVAREPESENSGAGRKLLPSMLGFTGHSGNAACASYRLREGEPERLEFDCPMQALSWQGAWKPQIASGMEESVVGLVEHVGQLEETYNVHVSPDHVYFAEGFLVHNCDDLISVENANSEVEREKVNRWYKESLPTRLNNPDRSVIINIMQRVHERDVSGMLLADDMDYEHVILPMEYEPDRVYYTSLGKVDWRTHEGELLFPERFPASVLDEYKKSAYAWASQHQQRPAPRDGGLFKQSWFQPIDARPNDITRTVRAWDLAATKKQATNNPDWTAGVKMSRTASGLFIIEGVNRFRGSAAEVEAAIKTTATGDGKDVTIRIPQDPGQAGKGQAEQMVRMLAGYSVKAERPTGDKATRAAPAAAQAEVGNVKILRTGDKDRDAWIQPFLDEIALFPAGAHDDQIDAMADALNELALGGAGYGVENLRAWG